MAHYIITLLAILITAGLLIFGLYGGLRKDGIASISLSTPLLDSIYERSYDSTISREATLDFGEAVADAFDSATSKVLDQVTDVFPLDLMIVGKVTIGSDQICLSDNNEIDRYIKLPCEVLDLFPLTFREILENKIPGLLILGYINVRKCTGVALAGVILSGLTFMAPFFLRCPSSRAFQIACLTIEVSTSILAIIPLMVASIITFSLSRLLRMPGLDVANRDLVWSLGVALALAFVSGILIVITRKP